MELYGSIHSISGSMTASVFTGSFKGDGSGLTNIPAGSVSGLNLSQIATGSVSASLSLTGFNVNTNTSITGSLTVSGPIISATSTLISGSSQVVLTSVNGYTTFSSSLATTNATQDGRLTSLETSTSSLNTFTSSVSGRLTSIETSTGSLNVFSSSTNTRLGSLETASGSIRTDFNTYTSSNNTTNTTQNSRLTSIETSTASLNTFSSSTNTFINNVNGGLEFTGSNVTVKGNFLVKGTTTSINSTTLDIGDNIISLNGSGAANGGLVVRDVTSPNTISGSILWDTTNDRWIAGPLGSEQIIVLNNTFTGYTSTTNTRLTSIETSTGSLNTFTGSINTTIKTRLSAEGVISGSSQVTNIANSQLTNPSFNIGTTSISLGRASAAQTLTGVSIDGNSATVTNGVYTTGDQTIGGIKTFNGTHLAIENSVNVWKYIRYRTGSTILWDVGTNENDDGGSYQIRPNGAPTNRLTLSLSGVMTTNFSNTDQGLTINKISGGSGNWNYIGFSNGGTRRAYFGTDSSGYATIGSDLLQIILQNNTNVSGNLVPSVNNTYNLGSPSLGWANIYTNDLHLSNMNKPEGNDIDGTKGTWTIQEGVENLYIINNNNGKKYKISLEEIL
jgi:hypothetical protein